MSRYMFREKQRVTIFLDPELLEEVDIIVGELKRDNRSYSRNQWIEALIRQRLEGVTTPQSE